MKLEVGMYVRSKNQGIFIISHINTSFDDSDFKKVCLCQNEKVAFTNIDTIKELKANYNITDLIEERDFVKVRIDGIFINWFMVDLFEDENENQELGIGCYEDGLLDTISEYRPLNTLEILEVLTKEQFERESFKVN